MSALTSVLRRGLLAAVSRVTRRSAVLLARDAGEATVPLAVQAPYRVTGEVLTLHLLDHGPGDLDVAASGDGLPEPASRMSVAYTGPVALTLRLSDGALLQDSHVLGSVSHGRPIASRRFGLRLVLRRNDGTSSARTTSHYLPRSGRTIDESYFTGEDYVDYESQGESVHGEVLGLLRAHRVRGPVLEIGCATGGTLAALRREGFDVSGLDVSAWAVAEAQKKLGDVVAHCDIEADEVPAAIATRGPFGCFVLASVLEHFADPVAVLTRLAPLAAPSAAMVIITTNADSLTSRVFGGDWEGYFDWTHKSVDVVTVPWLRATLESLGWAVRELHTWHLWDASGDPSHATLRDWHAADSRFRALLAERHLGDFIACVAVKEAD